MGAIGPSFGVDEPELGQEEGARMMLSLWNKLVPLSDREERGSGVRSLRGRQT